MTFNLAFTFNGYGDNKSSYMKFKYQIWEFRYVKGIEFDQSHLVTPLCMTSCNTT